MPEASRRPDAITSTPRRLPFVWAAFAMLTFVGCAACSSVGLDRLPVLVPESRLAQARVIYIAEAHDNPSHHQLQERVIRALHRRGKLVTVGMEMIDVSQQTALDEFLERKISWSEFSHRTGFDRGWGQTSPAYKRILVWCRRNRLPVLALNAPQAVTRKIARNAKLSATEVQFVPDFPEPPGGFEKFTAAMAGHPGSGPLRRYYEAQRAWETTMAARILAWLPEHQGTMVVLLGRIHADPQTGVPWYVARKAKITQVILSPPE
jgi:uncharacterized iron-regulated protein